MGGAVVLIYLFQCYIYGRKHHISKVILMSPAGYHRHVTFKLRFPLFILKVFIFIYIFYLLLEISCCFS